jgi:hypothetical protein
MFRQQRGFALCKSKLITAAATSAVPAFLSIRTFPANHKGAYITKSKLNHMPGMPKHQQKGKLVEDIKRYESLIKKLPPQEQQQLFLHVEFKIEEVSRMIAENPDCDALRVYYAKGADNKIYSFLAPVKKGSEQVKSPDSTTFYTSSRHGPPRCPVDQGIENATT